MVSNFWSQKLQLQLSFQLDKLHKVILTKKKMIQTALGAVSKSRTIIYQIKERINCQMEYPCESREITEETNKDDKIDN